MAANVVQETRKIGTACGENAQQRIVNSVARLAARHPGDTIALVTHAELVRAALLHYLHRPLDAYAGIGVEPASVSAVRVKGSGPDDADVLYVNVSPS